MNATRNPLAQCARASRPDQRSGEVARGGNESSSPYRLRQAEAQDVESMTGWEQGDGFSFYASLCVVC